MRKQTVCGCRSWRWESSFFFFFFFFLPNYLVGNPTRFLGSPTRLWRLAIIYDWQLFQFHPVFKLCNDSVDFSTSPFFWHCYYYHFSFSFIWSFSTNRSVNNSIVAIHFPPKENVGLVCLPFFYFISQFKISLSLPIWLPSMSTTSVGGVLSCYLSCQATPTVLIGTCRGWFSPACKSLRPPGPRKVSGDPLLFKWHWGDVTKVVTKQQCNNEKEISHWMATRRLLYSGYQNNNTPRYTRNKIGQCHCKVRLVQTLCI